MARAAARNEHRREPRWIDRRSALVRVLDAAEYPGVTGDISCGGMRIALVSLKPPPGTYVTVTVAFEEAVVDLFGRVRYALGRPWGSVSGVEWYPENVDTRRLLWRRYGS